MNTTVMMVERPFMKGDVVLYDMRPYYVVEVKSHVNALGNVENTLKCLSIYLEHFKEIPDDEPGLKYLGHHKDFWGAMDLIYINSAMPHDGDVVIRKDDRVRGVVLRASETADPVKGSYHLVMWNNGTITKAERNAFEITRVNIYEGANCRNLRLRED